MRFQDLTSQRFGRLVVVALKVKATEHTPTIYLCECDCGARTEVRSGNLRNGHTTSCGCRRIEAAAQFMKVNNLTHGACVGDTETPEYKAWANIKDRCNNPNVSSWERYGGRGVAVCERWASSFAVFLADVGLRPSPGHSIDRYPNNNGNYEPGNVRWATRSEQQKNKNPFKWKRQASKESSDV